MLIIQNRLSFSFLLNWNNISLICARSSFSRVIIALCAWITSISLSINRRPCRRVPAKNRYILLFIFCFFYWFFFFVNLFLNSISYLSYHVKIWISLTIISPGIISARIVISRIAPRAWATRRHVWTATIIGLIIRTTIRGVLSLPIANCLIWIAWIISIINRASADVTPLFRSLRIIL